MVVVVVGSDFKGETQFQTVGSASERRLKACLDKDDDAEVALAFLVL